jgi:hypothetical protein
MLLLSGHRCLLSSTILAGVGIPGFTLTFLVFFPSAFFITAKAGVLAITDLPAAVCFPVVAGIPAIAGVPAVPGVPAFSVVSYFPNVPLVADVRGVVAPLLSLASLLFPTSPAVEGVPAECSVLLEFLLYSIIPAVISFSTTAKYFRLSDNWIAFIGHVIFLRMQ